MLLQRLRPLPNRGYPRGNLPEQPGLRVEAPKPLSGFRLHLDSYRNYSATFRCGDAFLYLFPSRSNTAAHMIGKPTVASRNTSPKRPPSAGGTNLPQEIASEYGEPDSPPQYTGSGQMRTP